MPWSFMAATWSGSSRMPRMPPWIAGCSVLTRPSMISGKPVTPETSLTAMPAAAIALAVPPVEISSMPALDSAAANSTSPVLSDTDSSARRTRTRSGAGMFLEATAMRRDSASTLVRRRIRIRAVGECSKPTTLNSVVWIGSGSRHAGTSSHHLRLTAVGSGGCRRRASSWSSPSALPGLPKP